MSFQFKRPLGAAAILLCLSFLVSGNIHADPPEPIEPIMAPIPPENQVDMPEGRGFIPPRLDLGHLTRYDAGSKSTGSNAPAAWDWRNQGVVTSVKNQSTCGACYSFASLANFEAKLAIDGEGTFDLSENNAKECAYGGPSCDGGSNEAMANHYTISGVVLESCDGYVPSDVSCNSSCTPQKVLLDWLQVSGSGVPATATLQQYIYDNGPIYAALYAGDANDNSWTTEFNTYDGSYTLYYTGTYTPNHAVLIVGWDDSDTHAGGTGSWIVKNSWGTSWGGTCGYGSEGGFFKIAYGSASIGMWSSFVSGYQDYDPNENLILNDHAGITNYWGYGATTAYAVAKLTPSEDGYLHRVEFWTNDRTMDVDISIYDDFNGSSASNLLANIPDNSFTEAGYHSVAVPSPPELTNGDAVYVMIKFQNQSYTFPICADASSPAYPGTSYISSNGTSGSWTDLSNTQADDVGIRIRTSPTLGLGVNDRPTATPSNFRLAQNYPNPFNAATQIAFELDSRAYVTLAVYNVLGRKVADLVNSELPAGPYTVEWDGRNSAGETMSSGIYLYRIESEGATEARKMMLLK